MQCPSQFPRCYLQHKRYTGEGRTFWPTLVLTNKDQYNNMNNGVSIYWIFVLVLFSLVQLCVFNNIESTSVTSTGFQVTWECYDPNTLGDLRVVYTLTNKDQCNAEDELSMIPQYTEWGLWNRTPDVSIPDSYSHYTDISGLYPYSTYTFKIVAREFSQGQAYTSESKSMMVTATEAGMYEINIPLIVRNNAIEIKWNNERNCCHHSFSRLQ